MDKPIKIELNYLEYEDLIWIINTGFDYINRVYPEQVNPKKPNDLSVRYADTKKLYWDIRNKHG